jgi:hypothetical protein
MHTASLLLYSQKQYACTDGLSSCVEVLQLLATGGKVSGTCIIVASAALLRPHLLTS